MYFYFLNRYLRQIWGDQAQKRLKDLKEDDVFINFDADEIPNQEVCLIYVEIIFQKINFPAF